MKKKLGDKKILIIGASSIIAKCLVDYLLINNAKVDVALSKTKITTKANIIGYYDLANPNEINSLILNIKDKTYDYIYYNAGTTNNELAYNVNFYAFYLISKAITNTKFIVTCSISYLNVSLLKASKNNTLYNYRITKKMLMLYAYYGLENVVLIHPGLCYTKLFKELHPKLWFTKPFLYSPKKAARPYIMALYYNTNKDILSPGVFGVKRTKIKEKNLNYQEYQKLIASIKE